VSGVVVSNITIAAWVNDQIPPQMANAAIFNERSTYTFGIAINPNANNADSLSTIWNGTWRNWSGMVLPTNEWALVAMTISPTNLAVYLEATNFMESTNFAGANPPATFAGNSYIGWDTAGGAEGRLWTGPIADVMVFDQALSAAAVNSLYTGVAVSGPITLTISPVTNNVLTVTWTGGTLLEATNLLGPWTAVPGAANGTYTTQPSNNTEFYRATNN
jgi:hypothetical protein